MKAHSQGRIEIKFRLLHEGNPLILDSNYNLKSGETYSLNMLRFYAAHFSLATQHNDTLPLHSPEKYFLYNANDSNSLAISFSVMPGRYTSLIFALGVDSSDQAAGIQAGSLDPARGMFWTWNSGYVMAKLEGTSPASGQPLHALEYHLGGYRLPFAVNRSVNLSFVPNGVDLGKGNVIVEIGIAIDRFLDNNIIHDHPVCTTPGALAKELADRFSAIFQIQNISNVQ